MTSNTIAYAKLSEERRANFAREQETQRSNLALEAEAKRAHLASEAIGRAQVAAQNYATAQNAANVASQVAAQRYATLVNAQTRAAEMKLQADITRNQLAVDVYKFNQQLSETQRHNKVTEATTALKVGNDLKVGMATAAATGRTGTTINYHNVNNSNSYSQPAMTNFGSAMNAAKNLLSMGSGTPMLPAAGDILLLP